MITVHPSDSLAVGDQATASISWHLGQHRFVEPPDEPFGPILAIKDVTIDPGGTLRVHLDRDVEEFVYVVSGPEAQVIDGRRSRPVDPGTVVGTTQGHHRGHYQLRNTSGTQHARIVQVVVQPYRTGLVASRSEALCPGRGSAGLAPIVVPRTDPSVPLTAVGASQDVRLSVGELSTSLPFEIPAEHLLYVVVLEGAVRIDGVDAAARDGILVESQTDMLISPVEWCRLLLIDTPLSYPGQFTWGDARYEVLD